MVPSLLMEKLVSEPLVAPSCVVLLVLLLPETCVISPVPEELASSQFMPIVLAPSARLGMLKVIGVVLVRLPLLSKLNEPEATVVAVPVPPVMSLLGRVAV